MKRLTYPNGRGYRLVLDIKYASEATGTIRMGVAAPHSGATAHIWTHLLCLNGVGRFFFEAGEGWSGGARGVRIHPLRATKYGYGWMARGGICVLFTMGGVDVRKGEEGWQGPCLLHPSFLPSFLSLPLFLLNPFPPCCSICKSRRSAIRTV